MLELERKKEVLQTLETKLDLEKRKAYGKEDEIGDYTSWLEKSRGDPKLKDTKKIPDWGSTIELERKKEVLQTLETKLDLEKRKAYGKEDEIGDYTSWLEKSRGDPKLKDTKKIPDWGSTVVSINATSESHTRIDRQVRVLESRLDRALVKFNEALHTNKQLREQIDNLRRERGVFDTIYKKLEKELQERKKEMAFIIEVSNIAYEEKDNAIAELDHQKLFAKKEMESFEETFRELDELLEEDRKMKEAIKSRITDRTEKKQAEAKASKGGEDYKKRMLQGSQKQLTSASATSGQGGANQSDNHMTLLMYEDAFHKIRQATQCDDISKLVSTFLHSEDDNFSLFNYVNELNSELDQLEEEKAALIKEIETVKGNAGTHADMQRQKLLKSLEAQLKDAESQNYKYRENLETTQTVLDEIMALVEVVFAKMDCPTDKIVGQCGVSEKGTPVAPNSSNLLLYLAAIELRTDEFLRAWHRQESTPYSTMMRGPAKPFGQTNVQIDIPSTGDDYNDDDEDDEGTHVMSREELVEKSLKRIKQEQKDRAEKEKTKAAGRYKGKAGKK
ncbi:Outer dynein arm protein 1 [Diplonema papillatum]|nr:Outer dynein arm protein 1 [Diplonema papillatum]